MTLYSVSAKELSKSKSVPLHAMDALGGGQEYSIAPTHSRPRQ
jgi:hypothetical protein